MRCARLTFVLLSLSLFRVDSERFEVCDEGAAMPTATCRDCVIPACGDGVKASLAPLVC